MAIYNEILVARYASFIKKLFGMKGQNPTKQLAGEVSIALPLFSGRETRFLETWNLFGSRFSVPAVAAQDSVIRFLNQPGSNIICVLESVQLFTTSAITDFFLEQTATPPTPALANLSAINTACSLDARAGFPGVGTGGAAGQLSGANNIGQGAFVVFAEFEIPINTPLEIIQTEDQEWPILPGIGFQVRTSTLNVNFFMNVRWRERFLEESERQ